MIQLALYPQYKDGYSYTATPIQNEHASDGSLFQTLPNDVSFQDTQGDTGGNALDSDAANGNWKRFNVGTGNGFSYVAPPNLFGNTKISQGLGNTQTGVQFFSNTNFNCHSGIYQKIYNLVPLKSYDVTINCTSGSLNSGLFSIGVTGRYDTLGGGDTHVFSTNAGTETFTFEAQSTEEILIIQYNPFSNKTVSIDGVSIMESLTTPTFNYSDIYDEQQLLDLVKFDDIPLTLSVDEFKNATEKVQSYSKTFSLPATKNNNKVFFNLFDVTVSVKDKVKTFNPLMQTKAKLSEDGIVFFEGFLKLTDIKFVDDEPMYNVHLYSDVISLADTLKERTFKDLDFSELEHDYNSDSIEKSFDGELPLLNPLNPNSFAYDGIDLNRTSVLKYPFIDYTGNFDVQGSSLQLNRLEDAFRPFVNVKYLVDNIFDRAGFKYESNFFSQDRFTKLYMDFNFGEGNGASNSVDRNIVQRFQGLTTVYYKSDAYKNFHMPTPDNPNNSDFYDTSNRIFTATTNNQEINYDIKLQFFNDDSLNGRTLYSRVLLTRVNGTTEVYNEITTNFNASNIFTSGFENLTFTNTLTLNAGDTLEFQGKSDTMQSDVRQRLTSDSSGFFQTLFNTCRFNVTSIGVDAESLLQSSRGDIKQWDFIKSIFNMFNLITIPSENDSKSFIIEPYNDIFVYNSDSKTHDWTNKENRGQHTIKSLELVKTSHFTYIKDEDDHTSNVYTNAIPQTNGRPYLYGSETFDASNLTILRGEQTIDTVIFAPTLMKPIKDGVTNMVIPTIFKSNEDKTEFSSYDNEPRILYDNGQINGGYPYTSPIQNSSTEQFSNKYSYLQFSHFNDFPTNNGTLDLNFKACPMIFGGYGAIRNLFSEYWAAYYDELYHVDTKIINTELVLNANDLAAFRFYDKIILKNREYRVNNIDYKPNGLSKVELILIP